MKNQYNIAIDIIKQLLHNGFEAWIVGGASIDMLLHKNRKKIKNDIDVVTSATTEQIKRIFKNRTISLDLGTFFKVCAIDGIEVASYRTDTYNGLNDKNAEIKYSNKFDDAYRRDFTINSIYINPITNEVFDPCNGIADLSKRIIRLNIDPNNKNDSKDKRIFDDPNRILRAFRIAIKINGTIEPESELVLKKYANLVQTSVNNERIRIELLKVAKYKNSKEFFNLLHDYNILKYILPSLDNCYNIDGGNYHNETVFDHCLYAYSAIPPQYPLLRYAALYHDVGKFNTFRMEDNKISFHGHEYVSAGLAKFDFTRLKFSNKEIGYITNLIKFHMRMLDDKQSNKAIRRLLTDFRMNDVNFKCWLWLRYADRFGNQAKPNWNSQTWHKMYNLIHNIIISPYSIFDINSININGYEIMKALEVPFKGSPLIGVIKEKLFNKIQDEELENKKEILIEYVNTVIKEELKSQPSDIENCDIIKVVNKVIDDIDILSIQQIIDLYRNITGVYYADIK